ncbi:hypothetical protein FA15DRAFT_755291 [Coprinopsis marcescibilis]|uniref:Uncharacterized protein n=1 Tax=Coprinopsis marcescibilis TaxID=230819 RepID=A0A5C3L0B5_COPMA|nr:hypothetical protein FA15DRAFT_755291 [Coprinopsis marcescibilis]
MANTSLSRSDRHGDSDASVDLSQGLSTDVDSMEPFQEGPTCLSETGSSLDQASVLASPAVPVKAITIVPVSRLAFPFNLNNPSRRKPTLIPVSLPPTTRRFSCLPSPLALDRDTPASPRTRPTRHTASYQRNQPHHHGYSRQALLHAKSFWSSKEEAWNAASAKPEQDALTLSNSSPSSSTTLSKTTTSPYNIRTMGPMEEEPEDSQPLTIYPRRGDIAALRDKYCVEADQCFANVPIWTLAKVLWVHDLHVWTRKSPEPEVTLSVGDNEDDAFDESASEVSFDTTTGFSDDSESTLVDSESEWESSWSSSSRCDDIPLDCDPKAPCTNCREISRPVDKAMSQKGAEVSLAWARNIYLQPSRSSSSLSEFSTRPWNWYRRWDLLLELSNSKRRPEKSPPTPYKPLPKTVDSIFKIVPGRKIPTPTKPSPLPAKRLSFTRGFLIGFSRNKNGAKASTSKNTSSSFVVQDSFINPSHPAAG